MKKINIVLFSLFLMTFLAACNSEDASSEGEDAVDVVKIGALHPLTGSQASEGQEMHDAVQMAIDEVNEDGGIESLGGAKVELVSGDSENNPEKGVSEVQKMEGEVSGIVGPYTTDVALSATQEAERSEIPFIVDVGSADEITERDFEYTFRMQPPASSFPEAFLEYIPQMNDENNSDLKTVVNAHEDSDFGTGMSNVLQEKADSAGIEVLDTLPHAADTSDLSSDVNKIQSLEPDIVSSTAYLNDGELLRKEIEKSGYDPKAIIGIANGAFSDSSFIEGQQDINQYVMDINYAVNPNSDLTKEVKENYKEKYDTGLGPGAALSYTGTVVLLEAIEDAETTDTSEINEKIKETNLEDHILAQEEVQFDETGQNTNAQPVVNQIIDGESHVVLPEDYKSEDLVYPLP